AGALAAVVTVNTVWTAVGNGMICPSAVTHGSCRQAPAVPPQSASVVHAPKRLEAELVVQSLPPVSPFSTYVPAIGLPMTIGAQLGAAPTLSSLFRSSVNASTLFSIAVGAP